MIVARLRADTAKIAPPLSVSSGARVFVILITLDANISASRATKVCSHGFSLHESHARFLVEHLAVLTSQRRRFGELSYESFLQKVSPCVALTGLRRLVAKCRSALLSALFALGVRT